MSKRLKGPARDIVYAVLVDRDGERCAICKKPPNQTPEEVLEIDHVDGDSTHNALPNYRLLCKACNVGEENKRRVPQPNGKNGAAGNVMSTESLKLGSYTNGHHSAQVPGGRERKKKW